jgi:tetratricopeptide (TPR) repeat protein
MDWLGRNLSLLTGDLALERFGLSSLPAGMARLILMWCHVERGEFVEAVTVSSEAVRLAEAVDHQVTQATAWFAVGRPYLAKGDLDQAIPALERSLAISEAGQAVTIAAYARAALSYSYALAGQLRDARLLLEQGTSRGDVARSMIAQADVALCRAEAFLLISPSGQAREVSQHLLSRSRRQRERGYEAWALRLLGEIAARADPPEADQAEAYYRQALALADELGMRPLVAHCRLGLGTLDRKLGRDEQAQGELTIAAEMYRAMEMTFWLARAEAELVQVGS